VRITQGLAMAFAADIC